MPVFLITATDKTGNRETHRVEAETAQEACEKHESLGFTDIVLHDDDVFAVTNALFPPNADVEKSFTPAELVEMRYLSKFDNFLFLVKKNFRQYQWSLLLMTILVLFRWGERSGLKYFDYVLIGISIIACFCASYLSPAIKYKKMIDACFWGRWQETLDRIPGLRGIVPEYELSMREACALAGLGRSEEGLALMQPFLDSPEIPRWMYFERLADLFEVGKQFPQVIECLRLAYEEAPENPTVKIDYAYAILKYGSDSDIELATQLLESTKQQHLSDLVELFWYHYYGFLELSRGQYREAEAHFLVCQNGMIPLAADEPALQLTIDICRAYQAIATAELGETEKAEALYQQALPRLQALEEKRIMDRYAAAIA
ncbi:hypothetical protein Pan241w_43970 [Gimesia alba]|uniref:Tetratricopeptide repeat protein n=1 Tax=Gimesia alba TaxID=2527973 RepID=A0A517RK82_9PLAN|nr:hypothetical protein [Gimesia alba]QDT44288.1 hypothetical protein Pan241w_43970 [Gimesia alba]